MAPHGISAVAQELFHIEADKESHVSAVKAKIAAAGVSGKLRVILFGKESSRWANGVQRRSKEQPTTTGTIL